DAIGLALLDGSAGQFRRVPPYLVLPIVRIVGRGLLVAAIHVELDRIVLPGGVTIVIKPGVLDLVEHMQRFGIPERASGNGEVGRVDGREIGYDVVQCDRYGVGPDRIDVPIHHGRDLCKGNLKWTFCESAAVEDDDGSRGSVRRTRVIGDGEFDGVRTQRRVRMRDLLPAAR